MGKQVQKHSKGMQVQPESAKGLEKATEGERGRNRKREQTTKALWLMTAALGICWHSVVLFYESLSRVKKLCFPVNHLLIPACSLLGQPKWGAGMALAAGSALWLLCARPATAIQYSWCLVPRPLSKLLATNLPTQQKAVGRGVPCKQVCRMHRTLSARSEYIWSVTGQEGIHLLHIGNPLCSFESLFKALWPFP